MLKKQRSHIHIHIFNFVWHTDFFECCVVYFSENHYPLMMFLNSHFHPSAFCSCGYNFLITADQRINVLHIKIETVLNIDVFEYTLSSPVEEATTESVYV